VLRSTSSDDRASPVGLLEYLNSIAERPGSEAKIAAPQPWVRGERAAEMKLLVPRISLRHVDHGGVQPLTLVTRIDRCIDAVLGEVVPASYAKPADDSEERHDDPFIDLGDPMVPCSERITPHLPAQVFEGGYGDLEPWPPPEDPRQQLHHLRSVGIAGIANRGPAFRLTHGL
jgi:hypothetical protein